MGLFVVFSCFHPSPVKTQLVSAGLLDYVQARSAIRTGQLLDHLPIPARMSITVRTPCQSPSRMWLLE